MLAMCWCRQTAALEAVRRRDGVGACQELSASGEGQQ